MPFYTIADDKRFHEINSGKTLSHDEIIELLALLHKRYVLAHYYTRAEQLAMIQAHYAAELILAAE